MEELFLLKSKPRVAKGEEVFLNNKLEVSLSSSVSTLKKALQLRPLYLREVCLRLVIGDSGMTASDGTIPEKSVKVALERLKEYQCDKCVFKSLTARSFRDHVHTAHPVHKGINEDVLMKSAKIIHSLFLDKSFNQN